MTPQLGATPLRFLAILRLLKSAPVWGLPLAPGTMFLPAMVLLPVMAPILGMPLRPEPMALPKMAPLPTVALLPEAALSVVTLVLEVPLRLRMSLPAMAALRRRALLSGAVSLPRMMVQPVQALHRQGSTSPAFRMTPAG